MPEFIFVHMYDNWRAVFAVCLVNMWTCGLWCGFISHNWFCYIREIHLSLTQQPPPLLTARVALLPHFLYLCGIMSLPRSHTQRPAVSLHLFPTQRSKPLCLHLHPPYFCHHIQTIKKSSAAFDFLPFSSSTCYLSVLCALSLYRCRDPTKALHFTTI